MKPSLQPLQQAQKFDTFCKIPFLSCIENAALMWVQDFCKKGMPIDSSMNQEKVTSLDDNLKHKKDEASKAGEFNASKRWCDHFRS